MTPINPRPLISAHFTQQELDNELEELLKPPVEGEPDNGNQTILSSIDAVAADNGGKKTQDQWFDYWSQIRDGRIMAGMGDLYNHFKKLKHDSERGTAQQKAAVQTALTSLRSDFDWPGKNNWLIAGTRIIYNANNENAKIIQHYHCNKPTLITQHNLVIPVYRDAPIISVVAEPQGLNYLHTLLDTKDDKEALVSTLEFVSSKKRGNIKIWTAAVSGDYTRQSHPERAAGFSSIVGGFHVGGDCNLYLTGCSRGVR